MPDSQPPAGEARRCLAEVAGNLRWTWTGEYDHLFRDLDPDLWSRVHHNPVAFLAALDEARLLARAADAAWLATLHAACADLRRHLDHPGPWAARHAPALAARPVAYFSPEVGLHESLPIYSGGLGVVAGDHLKSCSDLGVPIWGVTLLYRQGYITQRLDRDGGQEDVYVDLDLAHVPLEPLHDARGDRLWIQLRTAKGDFPIDLWQARVGRARLLLLDGSRDPAASHRDVYTVRLYGGDARTRLLQELILGAGGYRALLAAGIRPGVVHLNEGHSGFALLEAIAQTMEEEGIGFDEAAERVRARTVFTTHTPVAAGHDRFPPELVEEFLGPLRERLRLSPEALLGLGRVNPADAGEPFTMTVLALRLAGSANGVSNLHGRTSRRMWRALWPDRPWSEAPIGHITNGVHVPTWIAPSMARLFREHLGDDWLGRLCHADLWERLLQMDPARLWEAKETFRRDLRVFAEKRLRDRHERLGLTGAPPRLDPAALTIGVARRFAEYKRAGLLFGDPDRLARLLAAPGRPVQILFAGKAHPQDDVGKSILRALHGYACDPRFAGRVFLLENHDMNMARHLVQGCDLWLNLPRRPLEACGTSGMKAVFNGTLNLMSLDGWWAEAYDGANGYAFGDGLTHSDPAFQDRRDAADLYAVLERRVVPDFHERDAAGVPRRFVERMLNALARLAWRYNSDRMVIDYVNHCYLPAAGLPTSEARPAP